MKRLTSFRLSLAVTASLGAISALVACGGISDPTRGSSTERVATVSGALTGASIPSNTRVALVWRVGATTAVAPGNDVAVVNGKFTMDLSIPPESYFASAESDYDSLSSGSAPAPTDDTVTPGSGTSSSGSNGGDDPSSGGGASSSGSNGGGFAFNTQLAPRDTVGGQITKPLSAAIAGFVVYVDTNGNGKLDLEGPYANPIDEVIGGNDELLLAYLRDGGALDYEKLRDRSGILPAAGYNLAWEEGRWLPLHVVELKLSTRTKLPGAICSSSAIVSSSAEPSPAAPDPDDGSSSGGSSGGYHPSPDDPRLKCSSDGYSYTYEPDPDDCWTPSPAPVGLCAGAYSDEKPAPAGCGGGWGGAGIDPDQPVPLGWPCPVGGGAIDGGAAPDAGQ